MLILKGRTSKENLSQPSYFQLSSSLQRSDVSFKTLSASQHDEIESSISAKKWQCCRVNVSAKYFPYCPQPLNSRSHAEKKYIFSI